MNLRLLAGWVLAAFIAATVLVMVIVAMPGLVPILLFAVCWWARPMTWESEFEHAQRALLKGAK